MALSSLDEPAKSSTHPTRPTRHMARPAAAPPLDHTPSSSEKGWSDRQHTCSHQTEHAGHTVSTTGPAIRALHGPQVNPQCQDSGHSCGARVQQEPLVCCVEPEDARGRRELHSVKERTTPTNRTGKPSTEPSKEATALPPKLLQRIGLEIPDPHAPRWAQQSGRSGKYLHLVGSGAERRAPPTPCPWT